MLDISLLQKKMDSLEFTEEENSSQKYRFLKAAVIESGADEELTVGNISIPTEGIKIDGYYEEEDYKVLHILCLVYDDHLDSNYNFYNDINEARRKLVNFITFCESKKSNNVTTSTELNEAIESYKCARDNKYEIVLDFYTNTETRQYYGFEDEGEINKKHFRSNVYFLEDIISNIKANETGELIVNLHKDFKTDLHVVKISSSPNYDVYSGSIDGISLAKVYDKHKVRLLEGNVRSYLKRTQKTNAGITKTIRNAPADFCAYNNGLSIVASAKKSKIEKISGAFYLIKCLENMQIVNGGQTTVTIYECFKEGTNLRDIVVPIKITIIKKHTNEAELVGNISKFANTQTAIAGSDLSSNDPFYIKLQQLSRSIPSYKNGVENELNKYYWFFERTNGQYNTERRIIYNYGKSFDRHNPIKKKYSKKILAKAIMSFEQQPDIVCLGNEKNFDKFNTTIVENMIQPDTLYYKNFIGALILWRTADAIILKEKLPIKAAVLPYTIAKISNMFERKIDLLQIWKEQSVPLYLKELIKNVAIRINEYFTSVLIEHPNTLMWGRKKECWTHVKNMNISIPELEDEVEPVNFLPINPANAFISDYRNMKKVAIWRKIILWNNEYNALDSSEILYINDISNVMARVNFEPSNKEKEKIRNCFMKAVRNGFDYEEFKNVR